MARTSRSQGMQKSRRELVGGGVVLLVIAGVLVTRRGSPRPTHASEIVTEPVWAQYPESAASEEDEEERPDRPSPQDDR